VSRTTHTVDFNALPLTKDYAIRQGDSIVDPWQLQLDRVNVSLVGCTLKVAVNQGSTVVIAARTIVPDVAADGEWTLFLSATDTASLLGCYSYEVEATFPIGHAQMATGATKTILAGTIRVTGDVA